MQPTAGLEVVVPFVTSVSGIKLADRAIGRATANAECRSLSADARSPVQDVWLRIVDNYAAVEAARSFSESVRDIPEVRAVVIDVGRTEPMITTYIGRRDLAVRGRIYAFEDETHVRFPLVQLDFRVLSLEDPSRSLKFDTEAGVHVLFSRS